ncbi:hypothetical protein RZO31_13330 [Lactococcus lactis]|uniref:Uncharacterized protein n=1 Tax=Lactococcus lactis TaxID=1358 RepID=A0AAE4T2K1_9LACT|nr:hypothetical protein [Lactococcus lactis]MDV2633830.1 hypothetical protein [Lactococcus lactis]
MKDIEKGKILEVTVNELVDEYSWLIAESSVQSIKKHGKMQTKTKASVIKALEESFGLVEYIAGKKNQKAKFILTNYNGNTEVYNPYKNNSRPSLDWTNELLVIRELINLEVVRNQEQLYQGFTVNQLFEKMVGFNKYKIEALVKDEVSKNRIFTLSGNDAEDEYYGLRDSVNNLVRNQKHIYLNLIKKELKKTNHNISFLDSNKSEISNELYEEYMVFKKEVETKIKAENEKIRDKRSKYFKLGLSTKDLPKAKNEHKEIENAVQEKFGFRYAYRLFYVLDEIQVDKGGDIEKVRENFYNRVMKNACFSQNRHEQTQEINYSETVFYRLCHAGLYVEQMKSIFSKLIETKTQKFDAVQEYEKAQAEQSLELYMAEQRLEQEEEFYNQDIYIDVERILYESENPLTDEECEERYLELLSY